MKVSEMNARQKKAFFNIKYAANDLLGGLENTMLDYPKDSEEYKSADVLLKDHNALVKELYGMATTAVYDEGFCGFGKAYHKKVFEGDIIDYTWDTLCGGKEHRTYVISYANNEAKFVGDCVIGNPRHSLPTFEYIGERGEVIGNIYDNKEILEGKE